MGLYSDLPQRLQGWNKYIWIMLLFFISLGWFYPIIGLVALTCMFAPVIVASITGKRSWCVNFCPRGIFNDIVIKKFSRNTQIPKILHSKPVKIGFMVFLFYQFIIGLINASGLAEAGLVLVRIISLTTVITVLLGVVFHPRSWCAFCPMGFLSNISIYIKRAWSLKNDEIEK
ncbi:MAG: 4Fe-4S binding protein [Bacillota bacterium]